MKFSKKKKAKMRKINQKKIKKYCRNMIGCIIYCDNHRYEVEDKAEINGTIYLLLKNQNNNYAICKIVKPGKYVKLSEKRILESRDIFSNKKSWKLHSEIEISEEGKIKSVEVGSWIEPFETEGAEVIHIYIIG